MPPCIRYRKSDNVYYWGKESLPAPNRFVEALGWAMRMRYGLKSGEAKMRIYSGFSEAKGRMFTRQRVSTGSR